MLDVDKKLACLQLRTFDQVTRCLHWRQRHTIVLRLGVGLLLGLGGEKRLQGRVHLGVMLKAIHVVNQTLVGQRPYSPFGGEPGDQAPPAELASTEERRHSHPDRARYRRLPPVDAHNACVSRG